MNRSTIGIGIASGVGLGLVMALLALFSGGLFTSRAQSDDGHRTYYVAPGGDCGSAFPCYATVQAAVGAADDPGDVIKVAMGIYTDMNHYAGLAQVVYVSKTVAIQGRYSTTNWLSADIDGEPRLGVPDLGADEYWISGGFWRHYLPIVHRYAR